MKKDNPFDEQFRKITKWFVIIILIILLIPFLLTQNYFSIIDFTKTGNIGDTIGGIAGPFIAIIAAALTFLAFWIQYKANEQLRKDIQIERFENRFYEMLRLYKEHANETSVHASIKGRKAFKVMYSELKECYSRIEKIYDGFIENKNNDFSPFEDPDERILKLAYQVFFHGIGEQSEQFYFKKLDEKEKKIIENAREYLKKGNKSLELENSNIIYNYFKGNVDDLSNYYRHLHRTVKFILDKDFLSVKEKYEYISLLRAQISEFEQLHIYYNGIAWFPNEWKEAFQDYRLVKNIPLGLANFNLKPKDYYDRIDQPLTEEEIKKLEEKNKKS
ncbi:putative phage abortive infection protein [uncultured Kordia sp.]|uniref:putative phage abortive infection protein n=1 Tax=uncultured Kordia sp. TaxID=507699 RepID=UPI00260F3FAC|nr:putative phage abortive infection protein [uncultured Kordia sp.]